MAENAKIKQIQIGSTTYDIEAKDFNNLSVVNNAPTPSFGATATIGSVNGTDLTIKIPDTNLAAASGGTDKTLVTTGDKYTWNNKAAGNHKHSYTPEGTVALGSNTESTDGVQYVESITPSAASGSATTRYLHKSTGSAAPNAHTHNITISGNTGNDSGDGTSVAKGDHTHSTSASGTASATGTTGQTVATGSLDANGSGATVATGASGTSTALTGVKVSSSDTFLKTINAGSGSLEAYDASTGGTKKVANGTRVPFVTSFSAGTTPKASASFSGTAVTSEANSGTKVVAVTGYPNFSGGSLGGTKTFVTGVTTGSGALTSVASGSQSTGDIYYLNSHTPASLTDQTTGTVGISGGSGSLTTNGTEGDDGIYYLNSHSAASLGTASTSSAAPGGHTHGYTTYGISGSAASGSGKYMHWAAGTTPPSAASPGNESKNTGNDSGNGTAVSNKDHTHNVSVNASDSTYTVVGNDLSIEHNYNSSTRTLTLGVSYTSRTVSQSGHTHSGTASASSSTTTVASHTHTHTYDKTTSVSLTAGTAPSLTFNSTASGGEYYVNSVSGGDWSLTTGSGTTDANSGTNFNAVTGYPSFSGGSASGAYLHHSQSTPSLTGTKTFVTNRGTFTADSASGAYLHHTHTSASSSGTGTVTFTAASLGTASTGDAAPQGHKHSVTAAGSVSLTDGTAPSATVWYLAHAHTGASAGTTASAATAVGADGTTTVVTGVSTSKLVTGTAAAQGHTHSVSTTGTASATGSSGKTTVASHTHTHSYGSSTALTTTANSGSAVSVLTGLTAETTSSTGDITYLQGYSVSGGGASATYKYFHPTFTGTQKNTNTPS